MTDIEHIRVPDEIKFLANGICNRFPKIASKEGNNLSLADLSDEEVIAMKFIYISGLVNEIIDNVNIVMSDLLALSKSVRAFNDRHPYNRFKFLVRTFLYEFGRFEDAFGYYTQLLMNLGYINKKDRKTLMHDFYNEIEPVIKMRNAGLHDDIDWSRTTTPEVRILQSLDLFGLKAIDSSGEALKWEQHVGSICLNKHDLFQILTSDMRTRWNMLFATAVGFLIDSGRLKKARY